MKPLLPAFLVCLIFCCPPLTGQSAQLIFEASFEDTLTTTEGEAPAFHTGVSFATGVSGKGVLIEGGDVLQYPVANNVNLAAGSMSLWVRPNWTPGGFLYRILVLGKDLRNFELHMDEGRTLAFSVNTFQIENNPIRVAFANGDNWQPNHWYFLTYTWNAEEIAIYVNGNKVGHTEVGFDIPLLTDDNFHLGSIDGEQAFNGTMDELRFYDAPLSPEEILSTYEAFLDALPQGDALSIVDIFGRDVTSGVTLVDWEGPVRNPAMKYLLRGSAELEYPLAVDLVTGEERAMFNLPSEVSMDGASKTLQLSSAAELAPFLFSVYMDEDFEDDFFNLWFRYQLNGLPTQQIIPVKVIDQDYDRPLSYPVAVDFSEARDFMLEEDVQTVIRQAAEDWLYYVDGTGIDSIPAGGSTLQIGGQDHFFGEKTVSNPLPYKGYYLYAYESTWDGEGVPGCPCSTGFPNRDLLQSSDGVEVPILRIGGLHLNLFGQSNMDGWAVLSPFENWTLEGLAADGKIRADLYFLAKHEIGHAMVFEESPLYKEAQQRLGFTSPNLTAYYGDTIVPLFPWSLAHLFGLLDPASQSTPYGGGVDMEVMPVRREMLTKLDILIMESVGYPLRDNAVTRPLSLDADDAFNGALDTDYEVNLLALGGIPVYRFEITEGELPAGLTLDPLTGKIAGRPEAIGMYPVTFRVLDYNENSPGATLATSITITEMLTDVEAPLLDPDLIIFPNPTAGTFTIRMKNAYRGRVEVVVFDPSGREVERTTAEKSAEQWERTVSPIVEDSGVYLVELRYGESSAFLKLIIQ